MILFRIGYIILLSIAFINSSHSQDKKQYKLFLIDNDITIQDSDIKHTVDSITWISLPHCSKVSFKQKFNIVPKIGDGISISEHWKKDLGTKFDSCSIIILVRYRGAMNFSKGGDNIDCYLLCDNDKIDIMRAGKKDEILYSIETVNGEIFVKINDWIFKSSNYDDFFLTSYFLNNIDGTKKITENLKIRRYKKVYQNSIIIECI